MSGHVEWVSVMIKRNKWEGFRGWGENDRGKREDFRQKCQYEGKNDISCALLIVLFFFSSFFLTALYKSNIIFI